MKRLLLAFVLIVTITGCSNKDKQSNYKATEVLVSGTILSIKRESVSIQEEGATEDILYNNVEVISTDDTIYNIYFNETIDVTDLHQDTQVNINAYTVYNEEYLESDSFEITSQPTQYIVGITAEELVSQASSHDKQMSHIDLIMVGELDYKSDGLLEHVQSKSQTVRSDKYSRRYISSDKNVIKDNDVNDSSTNEYYVTSNDGLRIYSNSNYTGWYYDDIEGEYIMGPDFTLKIGDTTITEYYIDDKDRVVVEGEWNIENTNFVGDSICQLLTTYGLKEEDVKCSFTAIYDRATLDLYNIKFDISSEVDGVYEDTKVSIKEFTATVYGIEYDKETVVVPTSIKESAIDSYYLTNPIKEVPELNVKLLLCKVFLETNKATVDAIKEYTQLDEETSRYNWNLGVEEICDGIKYWVNNYNTSQFMKAYVKFTGNEEHSKSAAASIIYSWLQKYNIKIDDYRELPTE